jgi:hypothetical protein
MNQRNPMRKSETLEIPAAKQPMIEKMLVDGSTFEDIVDAANSTSGPAVTLQGVREFFYASLPLQQKRVQRQLETARALKKAMGKGGSAGELADAVVLTGLLRLNRKGSALSLKEAFDQKDKNDNMRLKQDVAYARSRKYLADCRYLRERTKGERAKREFLENKVFELQRALDSQKNKKVLGPEAYQKIQEIYGLVSASSKTGSVAAQ